MDFVDIFQRKLASFDFRVISNLCYGSWMCGRASSISSSISLTGRYDAILAPYSYKGKVELSGESVGTRLEEVLNMESSCMVTSWNWL